MKKQTKIFTEGDAKIFGDIIGGKDVDDNATKLIRIHAFIDVRLNMLFQEFNQNDPYFLQVLSELRPDFRCPYFDFDSGFRIPLDLNFSGKINCLSALNFLDKENIEILHRLNKTRNRFAHDYQAKLTERALNYIFEPSIKAGNYTLPNFLKDSNYIKNMFIVHITHLFIVLIGVHQGFVSLAEILREKDK